MEPKYPDVTVQLTGRDGNAFGVIAAVRKEISEVQGKDEAEEFSSEAFACQSYDELLLLVMKTVNVE